MLHFAPEGCFRDPLSNLFGRYETADLLSKNVDYRVDLTNLPFDNGSYNFVLASHVLEHIPDDEKAISEIRRILKPNGVAVLAVPIIGEKTIEYSEANINEYNHMRSPGLDYFCKFDRYFSRIEKFSSESQPEIHQTFVYEDRTQWPTKNCPNRLSMQGEKHNDYAFVCYV
jgi:ubiquinone/menaquinone biosynthesis C-methylase UbiE